MDRPISSAAVFLDELRRPSQRYSFRFLPFTGDGDIAGYTEVRVSLIIEEWLGLGHLEGWDDGNTRSRDPIRDGFAHRPHLTSDGSSQRPFRTGQVIYKAHFKRGILRERLGDQKKPPVIETVGERLVGRTVEYLTTPEAVISLCILIVPRIRSIMIRATGIDSFQLAKGNSSGRYIVARDEVDGSEGVLEGQRYRRRAVAGHLTAGGNQQVIVEQGLITNRIFNRRGTGYCLV
ncbi:hypothetical protein O1426_03010 [Bacteroides fragilis]|nr:hypothetical protein [Bacteroides fragilis]MCZ2678083.1 hypothetical protein [Bacteroides fragilis]MCZ2706985.1 hypothetical protein [Bacteroides fragilis]UVP87623.1 hypothetical protein NXV54_09935 [Bacteroides fragilis]